MYNVVRRGQTTSKWQTALELKGYERELREFRFQNPIVQRREDTTSDDEAEDSELDEEATSDQLPNALQAIASQSRVLEDDPHVDWSLFDDKDDETSDDDNGSARDLYREAKDKKVWPERDRYSHNDVSMLTSTPMKLGTELSDFIHSVCKLAGHPWAEVHTIEGILHAAVILRCSQLRSDLTRGKHTLFGHGLMAAIWLAVCKKFLIWEDPCFVQRKSNATSCGTLFAIYWEEMFPISPSGASLDDLEEAIAHWEGRLYDLEQFSRSWLSHGWWTRTKNAADSKDVLQRQLDPLAQEYKKALQEYDIPGLARLILAKEKNGPPTPLRTLLSDEKNVLWWEVELMKMLASVDKDVLYACIDGTLPQVAERVNENVYAFLKRNEGSERQPACYANYLCDMTGTAPSPYHWSRVCDMMTLYLGDSERSQELAIKIDQHVWWKTEKWCKRLAYHGLRRYTEWRSYTMKRSLAPHQGRRDRVRDFISRMRERIQKCKENGTFTVPFETAVVEVGYTIDTRRRLSEHRRHKNSNYIMNLAETIFEYLWPQRFHLKQYILYKCWDYVQPWLSEIAFTQICQGYTAGARGFSHYPAGFSNGSAFWKNNLKDWTKFKSKAYLEDGVEERVGELVALYKARTREPTPPPPLEPEEREILRLTSEVLDDLTKMFTKELKEMNEDGDKE